jgi:peptidoglycan-N-acetylglucosamine deacetylase
MLYRTPKILQNFYPSLVWKKNDDAKTVYLTFDDGPIPEVTEWVLDILKSFDIKATFFCIGDNIKKHPAIFQKILDEKHSVGNHTFNHLKGWNTDDLSYFENAISCQTEIDKYNNGPSKKLFRPPYGRIKKSQIVQLQENGFEIIMWTTLSQDYRQDLSPEKCLKKTLKATKNGSIVLFHDSLKAKNNMMYVLPKFIETLLKEGYEFKQLN